MKTSAIVLALSALVSGCITSRAQTPVERPALEVPPVPPRVIDPAPPPDVSLPELVPDLPSEERIAPPLPKPRPPSPKEPPRDTAKPESTKTDIPPVEPPPVAPTPPIRTATPVDSAAMRDSLGRTQAMLATIDYTRLSKDRQTAYNQAKTHVEGAETALKRQDFELAKELADKAEKLARELQTR